MILAHTICNTTQASWKSPVLPKRNRDNSKLPARAFYFIEEVAALMGISTWAVYQAHKRGEIPGAHRVGSVIRVSKTIFNKAYGIESDSEQTG